MIHLFYVKKKRGHLTVRNLCCASNAHRTLLFSHMVYNKTRKKTRNQRREFLEFIYKSQVLYTYTYKKISHFTIYDSRIRDMQNLKQKKKKHIYKLHTKIFSIYFLFHKMLKMSKCICIYCEWCVKLKKKNTYSNKPVTF
jgi:hypothetical protein